MKFLQSLSDYHRAIKSATSGKAANLPSSIVSVLRARAIHNIGPRYFSLYDLARVPEDMWDEFIIDDGLKGLLRTINTREAREVVFDKVAFSGHCNTYNLPTIPILATIDRQSPNDPLNSLDPRKWELLLNDAPSDLFIKLIDGTWGIDAFVASRTTDGLWHYCDRMGSLSDLHTFAMTRLRHRRGWIVQPVVQNHRALRPIMSPNALGTVRAVTYTKGAEIELLYAVLRIPVGKNRADNFAHGTSGNLAAPVELASGLIGTPRASKTTDWPNMINVVEHPDTGVHIEGVTIPHWTELTKLILKAQATLPDLPTLGWDIAITDSGPLIVEANSTYDMDLVQVAYGRGVKSEFLENRLKRHRST